MRGGLRARAVGHPARGQHIQVGGAQAQVGPEALPLGHLLAAFTRPHVVGGIRGHRGRVKAALQAQQRRLVRVFERAAHQVEQGLAVRPHGIVALVLVRQHVDVKVACVQHLVFQHGLGVVLVGKLHRAGRRKQAHAGGLELGAGQLLEHGPQHDGARRVANKVDFQLGQLRLQGLQVRQHQAHPALIAEAGPLGVELHLPPHGAARGTQHGLEHAVGAFGDAVQPALGRRHAAHAQPQPRGPFFGQVRHGFQRARAPADEQGVDAVGQRIGRHDADAADGIALAVEAAVGVDHELDAAARLQPGQGSVQRGGLQRGQRVLGGDVVAHRKAPVQHHGVAVGLVGVQRAVLGFLDVAVAAGEGVVAGNQARRAVGRPLGHGRAERHQKARRARHRVLGRQRPLRGHAQREDPGIGTVHHPVFIRQQREAVRAPAYAPRVLHHKARLVVAHQRKGMATRLFGPGHGFDAHQVGVAAQRLARGHGPAFVHGSGHIDGAVLADGGLHVHHRAHVHPVVHAQRAGQGVDVPVALGVIGLGGVFQRRGVQAAPFGIEHIGPQRLTAHAMALPAFERAPAARPFVVFAGPFVVHARELIEHGRAHAARLALRPGHIAHEQQVVDDGGQAKAGAGAFRALVQQVAAGSVGGQPVLHLGVRRPLRGQIAQGRQVGPVAQVQAIGAGVQRQRALANDNLLGGHARPPCAWGRESASRHVRFHLIDRGAGAHH